MEMVKQLKFSDQVRRAIDRCGMSRYQLAPLVGLSQSSLSEFMSRKRGISMKALDRVAQVLGLRIVVDESKRQVKP